MDKQTIISLLQESHADFISYLRALTDEEFTYSHSDKWSAAQQCKHIVQSVHPLAKVMSLGKLAIEQNFGTTDRPNRTYEALVNTYKQALQKGAKATGRFIPDETLANEKTVLFSKLRDDVNQIYLALNQLTDNDLSTLILLHPLLGNLTVREMLYFTIYHVQHHQQLAEQTLEGGA